MPEIKNTFTGGRMNKDLDERLLSNGEYRDAMNVQVSTSEGSNIGAVQNILGNELIEPGDQATIPPGAICVGSIADEKNDSLYWFVSGSPFHLGSLDASGSSITSLSITDTINNKGVRYFFKDMIMRRGDSLSLLNIEPVLVDTYATLTMFDPNFYASGYPPTNVSNISFRLEDIIGVVSGMSVSYIDELGNNHFNSGTVVTNVDPVNNVVSISSPIVMNSWPLGYLRFEGERVLNFTRDLNITGINIIDDLLFWTSNNDEPKKINIPSAIAGTKSPGGVTSGDYHTKLIIPERNILLSSNTPILKKHITVIKKAPISPPRLKPLAERSGSTLAGPINGILSNFSFNGKVDGDSITITVASHPSSLPLNYKKGDILLLQDFPASTPPTFPIDAGEYDIRLVIDNVISYAPNTFDCTILSISDDANSQSSSASFLVDLDQTGKKLFNLKFPKFSFRYKYKDGEYSSFGPWSDTAFIPKIGDKLYSPKKGYNLGMENQLAELTIKNIVTANIPEDVVQVDILYKESNSPNIYLVDKIKSDDPTPSGMSGNNWFRDEYIIDSETIHAVLPENQLLRPWDNVPRLALAQEIIGNRIIYGNYLQNYDLIDNSGQQIIPEFNISLSQYRTDASSYSTTPKIWKSVKSMREYQLGIVYKDEFGRETPVLTAPSGAFKVSKLSADKQTNIAVEVSSSPPSWAKSIRYYIKETSNEYYNLAMDRWYDAQDGNIWLSFPSNDRNKLDTDNHIILKKVHNSDALVTENARFRVIAIENEAPDFIKTKKKNLGRIDNVQSSTIRPLGDPAISTEKYPRQNEFSFQVRAYAIDALSPMSGLGTGAYHTTGDSFALRDYFPGKEQSNDAAGKTLPLSAPPMLVRFINVGADGLFIDQATDWYEVSGIAKNVSDNYDATSAGHDGGAGGDISASDVYEIELIKPLGADVNWMIEDLTAPVLEQTTNGTVRMEMVQEVVEHLPEFDGRFFVKIEKDDEGVIDTYIIPTSTFDAWATKSTAHLSYIEDFGHHDPSLSVNMGSATYAADASVHNIDIQNFANAQTRGGGSVLDKAHAWNGDAGNYAFMDNHGPTLGGQTLSAWNYDPANSREWGEPVPLNSYWSWHMWYHIWRQCNPGNHVVGGRAWGTSASNPVNSSPSKWFIDKAFFVCEDDKWELYKSTNGILSAREKVRIPGAVRWDLSQGPWDTSSGFGGNVEALMPSKYSGWGFDFTTVDWTLQCQNDPNIVPSGAPNPPDYYQYHGKGIGIDGNIMEISFMGPGDTNRHKPLGPWNDGASDDMCDWGDMWEVGNAMGVGPQNAEDVTFLADCIAGAYCRFTNDPDRILRIKKVTYRYLSNYSQHQYDGHYPLAYLQDNSKFPQDCNGNNSVPDEFPRYQNIDNPNQWAASGCTNNSASPTHAALEAFWRQPWNRRLMLRIELDDDIIRGGADYDPINGGTNASGTNFAQNDFPGGPNIAGWQTHGFEIVEGYYLDDSNENTMSEDPAIWETEPKEDLDLDIFYEVGQTFPIELEESNWNALAGFVNSTVYIYRSANSPWVINNNQNHPNYPNSIPTGNITPMHQTWFESMVVTSTNNNTITVSSKGGLPYVNSLDYPNEHIVPGDILYLTLDDGSAIGVKVESTNSQHTGNYVDLAGNPIIPTSGNGVITLDSSIWPNRQLLPYHNCYAFGDGVESDRIRDDFNQITIGKGVKASSIAEEKYKQERRKYGLIYSGIYNSTSGVNDLNQFIMAEKITKDINPTYGSIQKLFSRDTDLVTLCEDKCLRILANKDAVYNADGNMQLTATNNVLGQTIPFKGEYGISKNPESFAAEAFRMYFTDKQRGAVMRLSMDGLTPISDHGMHDWFRDKLKDNDTLIGGHDDYKREYNITLPQSQRTVSFKEDVKGWVSFKSFIPENSLSAVNKYYSFDEGKIYQHHIDSVDRNTFYKDVFTSSHIDVLLNTSSEIVKSFNTLHYEGSQSRVDQFVEYLNPRDGIVYNDDDYHNINQTKKGWYVEHISTDLQDGTFKEFINKEGKWFNYIKGSAVPVSDDGTIIAPLNNKIHDTSEFSWQGIGRVSEISTQTLGGCMDVNAINYDCATLLHPNWTTTCSDGVSWDDGSCDVFYGVEGCNDPNAINYDCATATNPNSPIPCNDNVTYNDGSCVVTGCTNPIMFNYNPLFASYNGTVVDDGSCVPYIYGCTQITYYNYNNSANTACGPNIGYFGPTGCNPPNCVGPGNNECCEPNVYGCTDSIMFNYNPLANVDDGSCVAVVVDCMNPNMTNYNPSANTPCTNCCQFTCPSWTGFVINPSSPGTGGRLSIIIQPYFYGVPSGAHYELIVTVPGGTTWTVPIAPLPLAYQVHHDIPYNLMGNAGTFNATITFSWPNGETNGKTCDDSNDITVTPGCNDSIATNYNPNATVNDGSCTYCANAGCMDNDGSLNPVHNNSGSPDCTAFWLTNGGQPDNYDASAQCNDPNNPCEYHGCRTPNAANYSVCYNRDCGGSDLLPGQNFYNDNCCDYVGCTNSNPGCYPALEYTGTTPPVIGRCQDGTTCTPGLPCCGPGNGYMVDNYNPLATTNQHPITGQWFPCTGEIYGCTDPNDPCGNYDPCATSSAPCPSC